MKASDAYCDTDTLFSNAARHARDAKSQAEATAIRSLMSKHDQGKIRLLRSNVARRELENTADVRQRDSLRKEFFERVPVAKDEKLLGFDTQYTDPYGGFVTNPLVSDVQDERLCAELENSLKLRKFDAQQLGQAISNQCGTFLTRDSDFLKSAGTIEQRYGIKVLPPSVFDAQN
ncbi:hypothetical protein SBA7_880014 [Candidatus Sulfotelmatobacter sp. SbA7]|nr:hypothetical protein SBA7_880014 [Candidatus Sulfotelmatobacter sp. SbA7]